jgi:hypothetical protein
MYHAHGVVDSKYLFLLSSFSFFEDLFSILTHLFDTMNDLVTLMAPVQLSDFLDRVGGLLLCNSAFFLQILLSMPDG